MELGDDAVKIFLTPDSTDDDISGELEEFMNFVVKKQGNSDFTKGLEEAVAAIKRGEGWRWEYMHIKELYDEARESGKEEGIDATLMVIGMLDSGETDYKKIAEKANVSQDIVKIIAEKRVKH